MPKLISILDSDTVGSRQIIEEKPLANLRLYVRVGEDQPVLEQMWKVRINDTIRHEWRPVEIVLEQVQMPSTLADLGATPPPPPLEETENEEEAEEGVIVEESESESESEPLH